MDDLRRILFNRASRARRPRGGAVYFDVIAGRVPPPRASLCSQQRVGDPPPAFEMVQSVDSIGRVIE